MSRERNKRQRARHINFSAKCVWLLQQLNVLCADLSFFPVPPPPRPKLKERNVNSQFSPNWKKCINSSSARNDFISTHYSRKHFAVSAHCSPRHAAPRRGTRWRHWRMGCCCGWFYWTRFDQIIVFELSASVHWSTTTTPETRTSFNAGQQ